MLADLLAARWLGHGRAVECMLAVVAGYYGILLLMVPGAAFDSVATADIAWHGYGRIVAIPLLMKAALTGGGLILNIRGKRFSRQMRMSGAFIGSVIWIWLSLKYANLGTVATVGFVFCNVAAVFSIRIMGMAAAGMPRPGAPSAL
jgi:hypothetical protein